MVIRNPADIEYPSSDGKPMAENTRQFLWITIIKCGLEAFFRNDPEVFIAGDLLWYPVEGEPQISAAPDTLIVFGRPKGHRTSYRQWEEDHLPPQVVFEVVSPGNRPPELVEKHQFYETHGVEEYYLYYPEEVRLEGWLRQGSVFRKIQRIHEGWTSPRLQLRFEIEDELVLTTPDGKRLIDYVELAIQLEESEEQVATERLAKESALRGREFERQRAEVERRRAEAERKEKEAERKEKELARQQAEAERKEKEVERPRAIEAEAKLEALRRLLGEKGIDPDQLNS